MILAAATKNKLSATAVCNRLAKQFPEITKRNVPLAGWTTFHCSASAGAIVSPRDLSELRKVVVFLTSEGALWQKDFSVIGRGSNLLVRDGGYPGALIHLGDGFTRIEGQKDRNETGDSMMVRVEAGVANGTLLNWTKSKNLKGFGFVFGIPGSVGGGIRMNAGTPLGWFGQLLVSVEAVDLQGKDVNVQVSEKDFVYREFPAAKNWIIVAGSFHFQKGTPDEIAKEIMQAKDKRKNQPLDLPNTGSVFKNPKESFAGQLIEKAGLKGLKIGNAQISPRHANFIVNHGGAKTADALQLIAKARNAVREQFGIELETEVHVIGMEEGDK